MDIDDLQNRRLLLGVTGGIAAYKSAELVRLLKQRRVEVQVVMTKTAARFIAPLTLQALSGRPVRLDLWDTEAEAAMGHIELARWAEYVLVAPATADFLARLRIGRADDLLTTLCLATEAEIAVAPAMNRVMWQNPATQENIFILGQRGIGIWGPDEGEQACGEQGPGRMLEPEELVRRLGAKWCGGPLKGVNLLVTAGPTREAIDPVRFLTNHSSGKMGYAMAKAAREAGARVTLVSGPVSLPAPAGIGLVKVQSAGEMFDAVMERIGEQDIFIGTAAVADYAPVKRERHKLKKNTETVMLELARTRDILAAVAALENPPFTVGFAAETDQLKGYARSKLENKKLDMIAANRVGPGLGFEVDDNALWVLWADGERCLEKAPKMTLARKLMELIVERYAEKNSIENSG